MKLPDAVRIRGVVYPAHLKAPYVQSGKGLHGVVGIEAASGNILCNECGQFFESVTVHAARVHRMAAREYRFKHGLTRITSLESECLRAKRRAAQSWQSDELKAGRLEKLRGGLETWRAAGGECRSPQKAEMRNERSECFAQLSDRLRAIYRELGRIPMIAELKERGIHTRTLLYMFSVAKLDEVYERLELAGPSGKERRAEAVAQSNRKRGISTEYLINALQDFYVAHRRLPFSREYNQGALPSMQVFIKRFGGMRNAYHAAGLALVAAQRAA